MPHADTSLVPPEITSKAEFWLFVREQLEPLLGDQKEWVTNLANTASVIYNALLAFEPHFGDGDRTVHWCGFYLSSSLFPKSHLARVPSKDQNGTTRANALLLGPFCGKPACQFVTLSPPICGRGVCADVFLQGKTVVVPNVCEYPGHIACDGETKSEIICPLILKDGDDQVVLGVLDLDCIALGGFDEEDKVGLEAIADLIVKSCDW